MNIPLIDLKEQLKSIQPQADEAVLHVLNNAQYILGPNVKAFEQEICDYMQVKHAIGVANGTDALVIALKALGIGPGDEVIVPAFTFFASAEAIAFVGAKPVFVDVLADTYNLDVDQAEAKITPQTKAIMPVHLFGLPADMTDVMQLAKRYNLRVVEDCAQAIGAKYHGQMVGTFGDFGTLSFFPTKNLGCAGDGGMIVTNDDKLATIALALRAHGSGTVGYNAWNYLSGNQAATETEAANQDNTVYNAAKYYNYLIGHNSRLDEIQAALLRVKLTKLDEWNEGRRQIAYEYNQALKETPLVTPYVPEGVEEIYHMYLLQSDQRSELTAYLAEAGIATGVYYPIPLHLQKAFQDLGYKEGDFPVAEYLSHRTFAIPVYPELTAEQKEYILDRITNFTFSSKE